LCLIKLSDQPIGVLDVDGFLYQYVVIKVRASCMAILVNVNEGCFKYFYVPDRSCISGYNRFHNNYVLFDNFVVFLDFFDRPFYCDVSLEKGKFHTNRFNRLVDHAISDDDEEKFVKRDVYSLFHTDKSIARSDGLKVHFYSDPDTTYCTVCTRLIELDDDSNSYALSDNKEICCSNFHYILIEQSRSILDFIPPYSNLESFCRSRMGGFNLTCDFYRYIIIDCLRADSLWAIIECKGKVYAVKSTQAKGFRFDFFSFRGDSIVYFDDIGNPFLCEMSVPNEYTFDYIYDLCSSISAQALSNGGQS
jgi:hypothetical protein